MLRGMGHQIAMEVIYFVENLGESVEGEQVFVVLQGAPLVLGNLRGNAGLGESQAAGGLLDQVADEYRVLLYFPGHVPFPWLACECVPVM